MFVVFKPPPFKLSKHALVTSIYEK